MSMSTVVYFYPILGAKAAQNRVKIWIYSQKMTKNITFLEKNRIKSLFFLILGSHYPIFQKRYFFLLFSESHPILGVNPILRSNPNFNLNIQIFSGKTCNYLPFNVVKSPIFLCVKLCEKTFLCFSFW
jgi:hypothetical protein